MPPLPWPLPPDDQTPMPSQTLASTIAGERATETGLAPPRRSPAGVPDLPGVSLSWARKRPVDRARPGNKQCTASRSASNIRAPAHHPRRRSVIASSGQFQELPFAGAFIGEPTSAARYAKRELAGTPGTRPTQVKASFRWRRASQGGVAGDGTQYKGGHPGPGRGRPGPAGGRRGGRKRGEDVPGLVETPKRGMVGRGGGVKRGMYRSGGDIQYRNTRVLHEHEGNRDSLVSQHASHRLQGRPCPRKISGCEGQGGRGAVAWVTCPGIRGPGTTGRVLGRRLGSQDASSRREGGATGAAAGGLRPAVMP